jgi:hypothetical protein
MEVQVQRGCSERTAERQLDKWNWNYRYLVREEYAKCLDDWDHLTEFDKGRHIGILEAEVGTMKGKRGLK